MSTSATCLTSLGSSGNVCDVTRFIWQHRYHETLREILPRLNSQHPGEEVLRTLRTSLIASHELSYPQSGCPCVLPGLREPVCVLPCFRELVCVLLDLRELVGVLPGLRELVCVLPGLRELVCFLPVLREPVGVLPVLREPVNVHSCSVICDVPLRANRKQKG